MDLAVMSPAAQRGVTHSDPDALIGGIVASCHAGTMETVIEIDDAAW